MFAMHITPSRRTTTGIVTGLLLFAFGSTAKAQEGRPGAPPGSGRQAGVMPMPTPLAPPPAGAVRSSERPLDLPHLAEVKPLTRTVPRPTPARDDVSLGRVSSPPKGPSASAKPAAPTASDQPASGSAIKAEARFEGTAAPGLRIWLSAEKSRGEGLSFLWLQTKGPQVRLETPNASRVSVLVPGDATELGFRLVVSGRDGLDHVSLDVPLDLHARPSLPPLVVADAGDDQVGLVGHRITLNGIRSRPRERAAYRWIRVEGPEAGTPLEEAWIYSFVPTSPGLYRFVLVVSADGVISQPDEVRVSVAGRPPAELASGSDPLSADPIEGLARARIRQVEDGSRFAGDLAGAFEGVVERATLYSTYDELFSEIARRIDRALPPDQADREQWDRVVFAPLTTRIVQSLRPLGLELARSQSRGKVLSEPQKERLGALFSAIARGFRSEAEGGGSVPARDGEETSPGS